MGFQDSDYPSFVAFWVGFGFFVFGACAFLLSAFLARSEKVRSFSITNLIIVCIASSAYYTMARGEGYVIAPSNGRYVYWVRYVDWALTTPLLLLDMANLAGASRSLTAMAIIFDELMIILGLASVLSIGDSGTKWGWFALGNAAFLPILYLVLVDYHKYKRPEVSVAYNTQALILAVLWIMYPIAVGLGTESSTISSDAETIWIVILDVLAKTVFGSILLGLWRNRLPFSEGYVADHPSALARHSEYDERDVEGLDPATNQTYLIRRPLMGAAAAAAPVAVVTSSAYNSAHTSPEQSRVPVATTQHTTQQTTTVYQ